MASSSACRTQQSPDTPENLQEILIPAGTNSVDLAQRTLVGQLHTNKSQNRAATKSIIAKAWSAVHNLQISELGKNKFLFTFELENDCKDIMDRSP